MFGSKSVALCIAMGMIENIRYKLRCFRLDIYGLAEVLCDIKSVVKNSSVPASILSK